MKRHFFAMFAVFTVGAFGFLACTGDDPSLVDLGQDSGGSSGSSGASGSSGTSGSSGSSSGDATTDQDAGADVADALVGFDAGAAMVVFLTSGEFDGNYGGLSGADMYCQTSAMNGNLPNAATAGSYLAWLADATQSPATRFKRATGGYKRPDNVVIATSWEDLTDGTLANPINVLDNGATAGSDIEYFTNVAPNGTAESATNNCGNWAVTTAQTASYGDGTQTDKTWTSSATRVPSVEQCTGVHRILCFQQQL